MIVSVQRLSVFVLIALLVAALCSVVLMGPSNYKINTDLNSLTPSLQLPDAVNDAVSQYSQAASNVVTVLLAGRDEQTLYEALDDFLILSEEHSGFSLLDSAESFESYTQLLQEHHFFIMTAAARKQIVGADKAGLIAMAERNLMSQQAWFRLTDLAQDPWGLVNEYALQASEKLAGNAEDILSYDGGAGSQFFTLQRLRLDLGNVDLGGANQIVPQLYSAIAQFQRSHPSVSVQLSGAALYAADTAAAARSNIAFISSVSMVGIVLLLLLIFRSLYALLLPLCAIFLGAGIAFVFSHQLFGALHVFTIVLGASLIGVAVDYALHFLYDYQHAQVQRNRQLTKALLYSVCTSIVGYSALVFAGLSVLRQIAVFSIIGLGVACAVVFALGPLLSRSELKHDSTLRRVLQWSLSRLAKLPFMVLLMGSVALFLIAFFIAGAKLPSNDHPSALYHLNPDLVEQERSINTFSEGFELASFILLEGQDTQAIFDRISELEKKLGSQAEQLFSLADLMPSPREQQENYQANARLFSTPALLQTLQADYGLVIEPQRLSTEYAQQKNNLLSVNQLNAALQEHGELLWIDDSAHQYSLMFIKKGSDLNLLREAAQELDSVTYFSVVESAQDSLHSLRKQAQWFLLLALGLIAAFMFWWFPPRQALRLSAVPIIAISVTLLFFICLQVQMNLFHAMAFFLVVGLGMDYAIFASELRERRLEAVTAITLSALTSLLSFGLLALSALPAVSAFGLTVLIGNTCNFFVSLCIAAQTPPRAESVS